MIDTPYEYWRVHSAYAGSVIPAFEPESSLDAESILNRVQHMFGMTP